MPEFEETSTETNPSHNYSPSTDAKPRTRRRSGGFKKEYGSAPKGNMGEIDPTEALKSEKLSGGTQAADAPQEKAPRRERSERPSRAPRDAKSERPARTGGAKPTAETSATPTPTEETLAAIKRVEERIAARKAQRDAKHAERKKTQASKQPEKAPADRAIPKAKKQSTQAPAKTGLLASILKLFGLGPKEPVRQAGGKRTQSSAAKPKARMDAPRAAVAATAGAPNATAAIAVAAAKAAEDKTAAAGVKANGARPLAARPDRTKNHRLPSSHNSH